MELSELLFCKMALLIVVAPFQFSHKHHEQKHLAVASGPQAQGETWDKILEKGNKVNETGSLRRPRWNLRP